MTDPSPTAGQPLGDAARLLVEAAQVEARGLGHSFVGTEHLLLALLADPALAERARERGAPSREDLRAALAGSGGLKGTPAGEAGLSSQARRLLESAERTAKDAGAIAIDRKAILDRILGGPRGPLGKLLHPESRPRARQPEPQPQQPRPAKKAAPTPKAPAAERKPRESPRRPQVDTRNPEAERTPPERTPRAAPVVIRSRRAIPFSWRGVLLLLVPLTLILELVHAPPLAVFVAACLGVMPLASYMGEATEHLSARTGPAIGGLLNATFGNAAELIIAIVALQAGLVDLVKASITGSILGNLLLITGLSFVAGGLDRPVLKFNRTSTGASAGMLALAVVGLVFPALMHHLDPSPMPEKELHLSEVVAVVLAATYGFSLLFSLRTHRSLFGGGSHVPGERPWKPAAAIGVLALATAGVVLQSEILVRSVEQVTATMGLSQVFLGLIVIPIIGNAAEHATAVVVARKGQMDLALHIALGSSTQVALLVAPVLVLVGLLQAQPMNLVFTTFEVVALGLTTVITAIVTLDGESNWFEGVQLLAMFVLVAAAAYFI